MRFSSSKKVWPALALVWVLSQLMVVCFLRFDTAHAYAERKPGNVSTADHSKFEQLKVHFNSGPEVTRACLTCHTEAAHQIHRTMHWTWVPTGNTATVLGKRHVINNY